MASPTTAALPRADPSTTPQGPNLMDLPLELHYQISSYLLYPDALALKHTNRHFYSFVYTGVELKVNWLIHRLSRKLECPQEKCEFGTDEAFCCGRFRKIMEKRRRHQECQPAEGGCLVVEGSSCNGGNSIWIAAKSKLGIWSTRQGNVFDMHVLIICLITVCLGVFWEVFSRDLYPRISRLRA